MLQEENFLISLSFTDMTNVAQVSDQIIDREGVFTLPVLARATPATGVVPVQEKLVWGRHRTGVWHRDYRWRSGWGKLRFSCWISEESIVSFSFS